ncbi:MAG: hypothetical protein ACPGTS_02470, partial [Minisyncoccia bacterium]
MGPTPKTMTRKEMLLEFRNKYALAFDPATVTVKNLNFGKSILDKIQTDIPDKDDPYWTEQVPKDINSLKEKENWILVRYNNAVRTYREKVVREELRQILASPEFEFEDNDPTSIIAEIPPMAPEFLTQNQPMTPSQAQSQPPSQSVPVEPTPVPPQPLFEEPISGNLELKRPDADMLAIFDQFPITSTMSRREVIVQLNSRRTAVVQLIPTRTQSMNMYAEAYKQNKNEEKGQEWVTNMFQESQALLERCELNKQKIDELIQWYRNYSSPHGNDRTRTSRERVDRRRERRHRRHRRRRDNNSDDDDDSEAYA